MTIYTLNTAPTNHSYIIATYETREEAEERMLALATEAMDSEEDYDSELELQLSYFSIEETEADLYTMIQEEGAESTTIGEDIIDTFYNGNFSQGVEQLKELYCTAVDFGDYLAIFTDDIGYGSIEEFANGHFNYNFFICLGREL